ncbi:IclR family transcriptional regulator [Sphingomonas spermidinifaciens]|uniref:IclR family transcriptional regulator n=1 Tax=Sphingomonas spermidinifaciens TaxID=1141889 RepID=A0A2A4B971_9SPHN|nr:IclR family transcriptional regulator [Sphingomonas spermidinifaciens]PCD04206.1 IclR family transcriptional regulator [Sphingomonas spermidinifaciens]
MTSSGKATDERRYRAPALEKGLDILELLSSASKPMTHAMISQHLGRSNSELFRMLQVLEFRGFIAQADGGGFIPTTKLFALGMAQAPVKSILEVALPVMRRLADDTEQSCHLALRAGGDIVIAARMESAGLIGFSVRIGYRQPMILTGSGTVLYAFQSDEVRKRWEKDFGSRPAGELKAFRALAEVVRTQGYDKHPSRVVPGIIDLSAPVMRGDAAAAALTMPFVNKTTQHVDIDVALEMVIAAAATISSDLASTDVRV